MACNAASSYIYVMLYLNSIEMSNAKIALNIFPEKNMQSFISLLFKLPLKVLRYLDSVLIEMHMSFLCLSPFLLQSRSCVWIPDRNKTLEAPMWRRSPLWPWQTWNPILQPTNSMTFSETIEFMQMKYIEVIYTPSFSTNFKAISVQL